MLLAPWCVFQASRYKPVVDGLAIRQRQRVQVLELGALARAHDRAGLVAKRDAGHVVQSMRTEPRERGQQLRQRQLALADHDRVGARLEVLGGVVRALGAAQDHASSRSAWPRATISSTERRVMSFV